MYISIHRNAVETIILNKFAEVPEEFSFFFGLVPLLCTHPIPLRRQCGERQAVFRLRPKLSMFFGELGVWRHGKIWKKIRKMWENIGKCTKWWYWQSNLGVHFQPPLCHRLQFQQHLQNLGRFQVDFWLIKAIWCTLCTQDCLTLRNYSTNVVGPHQNISHNTPPIGRDRTSCLRHARMRKNKCSRCVWSRLALKQTRHLEP